MAKDKKGNYFLETIIAVIVALIISLVLVVVAALLIKFLNIGDNVIAIINQIIKGISILLACIFCLKLPKNGWIRGFLVGLVYVAVAFVVFSLLAGKFEIGLSLLNDVVLGGISGMISGIIAVNIRKNRD